MPFRAMNTPKPTPLRMWQIFYQRQLLPGKAFDDSLFWWLLQKQADHSLSPKQTSLESFNLPLKRINKSEGDWLPTDGFKPRSYSVKVEPQTTKLLPALDYY